jgi:hypothetical protein
MGIATLSLLAGNDYVHTPFYRGQGEGEFFSTDQTS